MNLSQQIYKRKSVRSYTDEPVKQEHLEAIRAFAAEMRPLDPTIKVHWEITAKENVKSLTPWSTPQVFSIFTEDKPGAYENVGFLFQQMDLYLQSIGLGSCWLGMGRMAKERQEQDGLRFVIMLAFGYPDGPMERNDRSEFRRRAPEDISDRPDEALEPARFAPSAVNSQPWYFTHCGEEIDVYRKRKLLFSGRSLESMNRIDMGICLAHLYVSNPETFRFFRKDSEPQLKGYEYTGSVVL